MKVDYKVTRISGEDRYETAAKVAAAGIKLNDGKKPSKVFLASGTSFADALAVSPVAFAKGYPIILTEKDSTSDFSKKELGAIGADTKILVGGTSVVSDKVKGDLGASTRVAGDDRAITANLVSDWAKASEGFTKTQAALVGGTNGNGADSLVASSVLGKSMTTLHFAGWDATYTYLKDHSSELTGKGVVFGGKAAVNDDQVSKAQAAAQTQVSNQSISVTPGDESTLILATGETTTNSTQDDRKFSVSGLSNDLTYRITLVNAANIKTASNGAITFLSGTPSDSATADAGTFTAAAGTVASRITVVNNAAVGTPAQSVTADAVGGNLSFTVEGNAAETLVPVVYVNGGAGKSLDKGGSSAFLELKATAAGQWASPVETFGLGGKTAFLDVSGVTLAAQSSTVKSGGTASITAQLMDGSATPAAVSLAGADVKFTVTRGASSTVVKTGVVKTDAKGKAVFEYDGPTVTSDAADTVSAFVDINKDGVRQSSEPVVGTAATITFSAAASTATAVKFGNEQAYSVAVGGSQKVSAMVADQYGKPMANKSVTISVSRGGSVIATQVVTTGADGNGSIVVTGPTSASATDTISATDGTRTATDTSIYWVAAPNADLTGSSYVVRAFAADSDSFDVTTGTAGTNYRLTYKAGDQFSVDGVAVDMATFEKALSLSDTVNVAFKLSGVSTWSLTNV